MRWAGRSVSAAVLVGWLSCSHGNQPQACPVNTTEGALSFAEFCAQMVSLKLSRTSQCLGAAPQALPGVYWELDAQRVCAEIERVIRNCRAQYVPSAAAACIAFLNNAPCDRIAEVVNGDRDNPCAASAIAGRLERDAGCDDDYDCGPGLYCSHFNAIGTYVGCPGFCATVNGTFCRQPAGCSAGEYCMST